MIVINKIKNMKNYFIIITINMPYPKEFVYRERASSFGTAIRRSIKQLRQASGKKRIKEIKVVAKMI